MQNVSHTTEKGFSLLELLLSIALLSILTFSSATFYGRFISQNVAMDTQDQLIASLRKAQIYSMMGKQNGSWGVRATNSTITLFLGSSYASRTSAFDETFTLSGPLTISGMTDIIFAKTTGLPNATPTVTISAHSSSEVFSINSQGIISRQ